jgi:hypothetical protein
MKPTSRVLIFSCAALVGLALLIAQPATADTFSFNTGNPDGKLGALSQRPNPVETETADDFVLTQTTFISQATITGLIPLNAPLTNINNVEVELYHVFPLDSNVGRTSGPPTFSTAQVPTRVNSPSDVEIAAATRDGSSGTLGFIARLLDGNFLVADTVVNRIFNHAGSDGPRTGEAVEITITFTPPILLPAGHYFFRPEALVDGGDFLYLSAPRPIVAPGTPFPAGVTDLQAWIRNSSLAPDWLRIGTDIIDSTPAPTFNMTFSLNGETVPEAGTPGQANCHGKTVSALATQFGGLDAASSAVGFFSVAALQDAISVFCKP